MILADSFDWQFCATHLSCPGEESGAFRHFKPELLPECRHSGTLAWPRSFFFPCPLPLVDDARGAQDTFYLSGGPHSHTDLGGTGAQDGDAQAAGAHRLPGPLLPPRHDGRDAQRELPGLRVDRRVSLVDLKSDMDHFARRPMDGNVRSLFSAHYLSWKTG